MRRKQRVGTGRPRRGATLVFVAIFAVALVGLAAFAIDVSRLYVGTSELQTGADAAALRGAQFLQYNTGADPTSVTKTFALANEALGDSLRLANADIWPVSWNSATGIADTTVSWALANAVRVDASRPVGLLFGGLVSSIVQRPRRRAIAWIANINRVTCPTPWGFPIKAINSVLYEANDDSVRFSMFDSLSAKLAAPGPLSVTVVFYPSDEPQPTPLNESWAFEAIDDKNVNMNAYADQVADASSCNANKSIAVDTVETFPGKGGGAIPQKTVSGAFGAGITGNKSLCEPPVVGKKGDPIADCYPVGSNGVGSPGVTVMTSFISSVSSSSAKVVSLGGFRVMCVFNGKPGGPKTQINNDPKESCAWYDAYRASSYAPPGLPVSLGQGTIVGYPVPSSPGLGQGTTLGNAPALGQRLILVR